MGAPAVLHADVVINEIAWMGSADNANAEWIELYNSGGESVDLSGWTLSAADGSPSISLSGSIGANAFFLLERTSDATVAGITAGVIYSGALGNSGETLTLRDSGGTVIDTVVSGENWQSVGGDNTSKQTPQRGSSGWITALPTPGAVNAGSPPEEDTSTSGEEEETPPPTETTPAPAANNSAPVSSYVAPPVPVLFADAGKDMIVIVGADVQFTGLAYDRSKNTPERVRYAWNFGDGSTAEGISVMHRFEYPGKYAVVLSVAQDRTSAADRLIVTAEPAKLSFRALPDGGVTIENRSGRDLDLSLWLIGEGAQRFMLPEGSIILAGESMAIAQRILRFYASASTELLYPNGVRVLAAGQSTGNVPAFETVPSAPQSVPPRAPVPSEAEPEYAAPLQAVSEDVAPLVATSSNTASAASAAFSVSPWFLGALGLAFAGAGAGWYVQKSTKKEWDIEEMSDAG